MTRTECEAKLMEHMEAMVAILHEYNPDSEYLSACYFENADGQNIFINNDHFVSDAALPVDCGKVGNTPMQSFTAPE